ncbi:MAG: ABC transporter permease, partial [Hyphomonadaceae bacterium]|nr:ABC transporter permease [Clostridia bacterium]
KFKSTGYFLIKQEVNSESEINALIDSGKIKTALIIPTHFARDIKSNKSPTPQLIIDGSDPTVARTALSSGMSISGNYSLDLRQQFLSDKGMGELRAPGVSLNTKVRYNPNMESNRFTVPGLVGLIMQNITIMLTAFALVREKERGTIEQLIVTPIKSIELILGKMIPYIAIGYAGFLFSLFLCRFWFGVPILGSLPLLLLLGGLFVICALAIGMLISTIAQNQTQAMQVTLLVLLPSILLSGFIFPIEAMPVWIQPLSLFIPLTYFLTIVRGIILKGVGMEYLWTQTLMLFLFMVAILSLAVKRFKKSLD